MPHLPQAPVSRRALLRGGAALLGAGAVGASAQLSARAAVSSSLTTGQYSITTVADTSAVAKMGLAVLLPHEWTKVAAIKATNPGCKVFVYKNVGAVSALGNGPYQPSVVTYQQVESNPGWRVHDSTGKAISWTDFGGYLRPIDPGDPGVVAASAQALVDECRAHGFDGILLDDLNSDWSHYNDGSSYPVDFTGGSVFASTRTWVEQVVPKLRSAGLEVVGNAQINPNTFAEVLGTWATHLNGVALEHFTRWGDYSSPQWPNFTGWEWDQRRQHCEAILSKGAYVLGMTYGDAGDVTGQRYHRASFLLLTGGHGYSMWTPSHYQGSFDAPAAFIDLGAPRAAAEQLPDGMWKRAFERGFVLVNPTTSAHGWSRRSIWFGTDTTWSTLASGDAVIVNW